MNSASLPAGHLLVRCNNRRTTRCPSCAETYRRDTFHLITAGLRGGKGTPDDVAQHPRVFATFTAPGFGPVHNRPDSGRCRCGSTHPADAPELGTPLNPDTYDYEAAVLWNAHAGALWRRFTIYLRREIAKRAGLSQRAFRQHARVSFAKVAEYQRRGAVHFHAVIRLDGPEGGTTPPPAWASPGLLTDAIQRRCRRSPGSPAPRSTAAPTPSPSAASSTSAPSAAPTSAAPTSPTARSPRTSPSTPPREPKPPPAPSTAPSASSPNSPTSTSPTTPPA